MRIGRRTRFRLSTDRQLVYSVPTRGSGAPARGLGKVAAIAMPRSMARTNRIMVGIHPFIEGYAESDDGARRWSGAESRWSGIRGG